MVNFYFFIGKSRKIFLLLILGCIGMMQVKAQLGTNLVVNGDAETPPAVGSSWIQGGTDMGHFSYAHQGAWYLPDTSSYPSSLPASMGGGRRGAHGGAYFFNAGTDYHLNDPPATLTQLIDVHTITSGADITFNFGAFVATAGYFGAAVGGDSVEISVKYMDGASIVKQSWDTTWHAETVDDYGWHNLTHSENVLSTNNVTQVEITLSAFEANSAGSSIEVYFDDIGLIGNLTPLPLTLLNFTAAQRPDHTVGLQWQTGQEQNSNYIEVQRSGDGKSFGAIGQVPAAGNSQLVKNYSFTDASPLSGNNFYRLKLVDLDGAFKYSKVLEIRPTVSDKTIEVFSNPFHDQIGMRIAAAVPDRLVLSLMDAMGRVCLRQSVNTQSGNNFINLYPSAGMASGVYFLHIQGSHTDQTIRVLKQ